MTLELVTLIATSLVVLQLLGLFQRGEHRALLPYLGMLVADLAVLGWVQATSAHASMVAFVADGVAAVLVWAPRFLDRLERRAMARDQLGRALAIAGARELLVPGGLSVQRRQHLADLVEIEAGRPQVVIARLRQALAGAAEGLERHRLEERLFGALLYAGAWGEALVEIGRRVRPAELRERPLLLAQVVRALGELDRLEEAGRLVRAAEESRWARESRGTLAQIRAVFLSYAGKPEHVEAILATAGPVSPKTRALLLEGARARAARARQGGAGLPLEVEVLADEIFRRALIGGPGPAGPPPGRRASVTWALIVANVAVFAWVRGTVPLLDEATLVRAGALFRPAIAAGEVHRIATAMFLHAGWLHLGLNMYGLLILGRFTEDVFGPSRYLVIYTLAGVSGGVASTLLGPGAISVGASGAIMGLLGALIVTLIVRRGSWPEAWRRSLLWNLVILAALQVYIGLQLPMIDNAAHVGGMVGGAAATLAFAPGGLMGDRLLARRAAFGLALLAAAGIIAAGARVVWTGIDDTLRRVPCREVALEGVRLSVPAYWEVDRARGLLYDPLLDLRVELEAGGGPPTLLSPAADDPRFRPLLERIRASARPVGEADEVGRRSVPGP